MKERDGYHCVYCQSEDDLTVDHVEPKVLHPEKETYRDDELVTACRPCNGRKSDNVLVRLDYRNPRYFPLR